MKTLTLTPEHLALKQYDRVDVLREDGTIERASVQAEATQRPEGWRIRVRVVKPGATAEEVELVRCTRAPASCPACGQDITTPVVRQIRVNRKWEAMTFCSGKCGGEYQMGCEG